MPGLTTPRPVKLRRVPEPASVPCAAAAVEPLMAERVITPQDNVRALVRRSRNHSRLSEARALALALKQVRLVRQK